MTKYYYNTNLLELLPDIINKYNKCVILTDTNIYSLYSNLLETFKTQYNLDIIKVVPSEASKSIDNVKQCKPIIFHTSRTLYFIALFAIKKLAPPSPCRNT